MKDTKILNLIADRLPKAAGVSVREIRNLVVFVAAIAGGFVYICSAIPQIKSEPVVEQGEIGSSPEELVAAGKRIFNGDRAQCLTCHSLGDDPKARCPNQEGLGERASKSSTGLSAAEYLVESVYNPNVFVVPGYPKNQMTPVNKPPIALSHDEILAVIAFLNTLGGTTDENFIEQVREAQDPWRKGLLKPEEGAEAAELPILLGNAERGRKVFEAEINVCNKCHRVATEGADIGPELTAIGASQSADYILESILDPNVVIVKGYNQIIVIWEDMNQVRGTPVAWIPDKEHPSTLRVSMLEGGESKEREIDITKAVYVGDTFVGIETEDDLEVVCGEYIEGDEETGVTLRILAEGSWVQRRFAPEEFDFVDFPISPMPSNYGDLMTPQEMYDLIAYLVAQKVKK